MKMFEQLSFYKCQLEAILSLLEDRDFISEEAQERLEERVDVLQDCIDKFDELIDSLTEYQKEYKGLGGI